MALTNGLLILTRRVLSSTTNHHLASTLATTSGEHSSVACPFLTASTRGFDSASTLLDSTRRRPRRFEVRLGSPLPLLAFTYRIQFAGCVLPGSLCSAVSFFLPRYMHETIPPYRPCVAFGHFVLPISFTSHIVFPLMDLFRLLLALLVPLRWVSSPSCHACTSTMGFDSASTLQDSTRRRPRRLEARLSSPLTLPRAILSCVL